MLGLKASKGALCPSSPSYFLQGLPKDCWFPCHHFLVKRTHLWCFVAWATENTTPIDELKHSTKYERVSFTGNVL